MDCRLIAIAVFISIFNLNDCPAQDHDCDEYEISGFVMDDSLQTPLIAAEIYINKTRKGTVSNQSGEYSLFTCSGRCIIVCNFMGYEEKRIAIEIACDTTISFFMKPKRHEIHDVFIIASLRSEDPIVIGRPIENIGETVLNTLNTNDVNDALHGRIPGVWDTKISGAPGDHNRIRIRGLNSIFGSADPLYIVDGMIVPVVNSITLGISDLNSHDVENITVLKDASSTSLYGYLGGNGVILIDTKKGGGRNRLSFSYKLGVQTLPSQYRLMNSQDFLNTIESSDNILGTRFYFSSPTIGVYPKYPKYIDVAGNPIGSDDSQAQLFTTGILNEYNLSGQGTVHGFNYYVSGNYYDHHGIVENTRYQKYTLTANTSRDFGTKLKLRVLYKGSHQKNLNTLDNYLGNSTLFKGINYEPSYNYTPDSIRNQYYRHYYNFLNLPLTRSGEILQKYGLTQEDLIWDQERSKRETTHSGSIIGEYRIMQNLLVNAKASVSLRNNLFSSILPHQDQYLKSKEGVITFDQQYDLRYHKQWKVHKFDAMVRYIYHRDNTFWTTDSLVNTVNYLLPSYNDVFLRGSQAVYGEEGSVNRQLSSSIINVNYNYRNRYFVSYIGNYSLLREGHYVKRDNLFSSVTFNWDLAKESLLKSISWLDALNIYCNWGQVGNYPLNSLSNDLFHNDFIYFSNSHFAGGAGISTLANHFLVHEKINETNIGSWISILERRIELAGDLYLRNYNDLLLYRSIPPYYGGGIFLDNIGQMINRGLEISLELKPVERASWAWISKAGFSTNEQHITNLNDGIPLELTSPDPLYPDFLITESLPLGDIIGYKYLGKWKDLQDEKQSMTHIKMHQDLAYLGVDTTQSGITEYDKTVIGNSIPDFTLSWINTLQYKGFSCDMHWYGVIGVEKYNATKAATYITGNNTGLRNMVFDTIHGVLDQVFYESSFFVEDASFIRLKLLKFSYNAPHKVAQKIGWKISLSFENLITLTRYTGYDPEASIYTDNTFTDNAIDWGAYPNPRGYFISIGLEF